jgi:hypothetical protein
MKEAWITMVCTSDYVAGALVLAHTLRSCNRGEPRPLLCMTTDGITEEDTKVLRNGGLEPVPVQPIEGPHPSHVSEWDRVGYTKLNLWRMEDWDVLVYIDADCLVVGDMEVRMTRAERPMKAEKLCTLSPFMASQLPVCSDVSFECSTYV